MTKPKRKPGDRQIDKVLTEAYQFSPSWKAALTLRKMQVTSEVFADYLTRTWNTSEMSDVARSLQWLERGEQPTESHSFIVPKEAP